jgi:thioredoxin-dependent peroxiredoxin
MSTIKIGDKAPSIIAKDQHGNRIDMADFAGKKVILFFYPKADTPGCTAEACNLRDHYEELSKKGFVIIGVSADNEKAQKKFSDKYNFPYPLIPDTTNRLSMLMEFGVLKSTWENHTKVLLELHSLFLKMVK